MRNWGSWARGKKKGAEKLGRAPPTAERSKKEIRFSFFPFRPRQNRNPPQLWCELLINIDPAPGDPPPIFTTSCTPKIQSRPFFCLPQCFIHEPFFSSLECRFLWVFASAQREEADPQVQPQTTAVTSATFYNVTNNATFNNVTNPTFNNVARATLYNVTNPTLNNVTNNATLYNVTTSPWPTLADEPGKFVKILLRWWSLMQDEGDLS